MGRIQTESEDRGGLRKIAVKRGFSTFDHDMRGIPQSLDLKGGIVATCTGAGLWLIRLVEHGHSGRKVECDRHENRTVQIPMGDALIALVCHPGVFPRRRRPLSCPSRRHRYSARSNSRRAEAS